ncbi:DUF1206 domain-containing protein [Streptomyces capparidis]
MIEGAARWGLIARGVLYLLIGALALRIAFSGSGEQADRKGALEELAEQPFGKALVWAVGIGLVGMALWRLSEVVFGGAGQDGRKATKRAASAARCVFYSLVAYSVLSFAGGGSSGSSSDQQSKDVTARVLELPAGRWLVGAAGLALAGAGVFIAVRAAMRSFRKRLKQGEMSPTARRVVDVLGVAGGIARAALFATAGCFAVRAAVEYDADEAKGMDDTLRSFADTTAGPWLLAVVAVGLVLFSLFSFAMARWRRV